MSSESNELLNLLKSFAKFICFDKHQRCRALPEERRTTLISDSTLHQIYKNRKRNQRRTVQVSLC